MTYRELGNLIALLDEEKKDKTVFIFGNITNPVYRGEFMAMDGFSNNNPTFNYVFTERQ